ncbi:CDP-alcohol phosphatidyltransferase family protein, partial [Halorubrum tibetense]
MTLDRFRPVADRMLGPWVHTADRLGLSPDGVSLLAFAAAVLAA